LGALGGFFLPLGFAYFDRLAGRPESCFWLLLGLVSVSCVWLAAVVTQIKRGARTSTSTLGPELSAQ
jgi:nitrate/nitrite transporter NarK